MPDCKHEKCRRVDDIFRQCKTCRIYLVRKSALAKVPVQKLPAILKGRRLPPTDPGGRYFSDIVVVKRLVKLRRSIINDDEFYLLVRFPRGWKLTQIFTTMQ